MIERLVGISIENEWKKTGTWAKNEKMTDRYIDRIPYQHPKTDGNGRWRASEKTRKNEEKVFFEPSGL